MNKLMSLLLSHESLRRKLGRRIGLSIPLFRKAMTIDEQIAHALCPRPHYAYCMLQGARLAKRLGFQRTSIIEFGVAGGLGLIAAEYLAEWIHLETGVHFDIYGFDLGSGLPTAMDFRDMPYHWKSGYYQMDEVALRSKLTKAQLVLGPISETVPETVVLDRFKASPISTIFFDVDFYSSTIDAFRVFDAAPETRLPRVMCYMDDIVGEVEQHSDFTGVRGAIAEFNRGHTEMKISGLHLASEPDARLRASRLMIFHDFDHAMYCTFVGDEHRENQLRL